MASLKRTAIFITLLAIVLKLSGFLRESIIARQFGATEYTDGYLLAFSLITLIVAMISGGFNNVFLPLYVKAKQKDPKDAEKNANGILNRTVLTFLVVTAAGYFLIPIVTPVIFGSINPVTEEIAVELMQFFFLFMAAIALNSALESYLQGRRIFVPSQVSRLAATLMGAVFALFFAEQWGIYSVAYGFIVGIFLGVVVQFVYLLKSGYRYQPTLAVDKDLETRFLALLFPALLNSVVGQINMFVNKIFASNTIEGAVTYLNNASLLVSIPNAIYATTIAAIIFTLLSEQVDDKNKFQRTVFMGLELTLVTLAPIAVGLLLIGEQAISFVYERGMFTAQDTSNTYLALALYIPLIITQGIQYIISKSMYAQGKTAIILKISSTTILLNLILNFFLVKPFGYPGLALSASLVSVYYLGVSTFFLFKGFDEGMGRKSFNLVIKVLLPTILMAVPIFLLQRITFVNQLYSLWQLALLIPVGVVVYTAGLYVFYREGFYRILDLVRRKKVNKAN